MDTDALDKSEPGAPQPRSSISSETFTMAQRIVFTGANLLDGDSAARPNQTVVVEDGRFAVVDRDGAFTPSEADCVIALDGDTLMPGMVQAHWHGPYEGLDFTPPPVGLEKPPGYLMLLAAKHARLALDRGFTSVIGAAAGDAIDAQLKQAIADGVLVGPRILAGGRWLITTGDSNELPEFWWWGIQSMGAQRVCDGPDEFRKGVRREIHEGSEIIKIFNDSGHALLYGMDFVSMTDEELHAAVEATHHRGKLIRSHVTHPREIMKCIRAGVDVLDHVDGMDRECIDAMLEAGSFVCPSLYLTKAVLETIKALGEGKENEPFFVALQRDFDHMCEILPEANAAGVQLMVGDDWGTAMTPHGDYVKEMELYVDEVGIDPLDVIRWATVNGTRCMRMGDELGTVAAGKVADLVLVKGDPSKNISLLGDPANLLAVMKDGVFTKTPGGP
jgi:imidazolonepropionase-like amidohydrolase